MSVKTAWGITMVATFLLASLVYMPQYNARALRHAGCDEITARAGCLYAAADVAVLRGTFALSANDVRRDGTL